MFDRFSDQGRQVVVLAQDEARMLRHNYIGTEHLLLGLLRQNDTVAADALACLDVALEETRDRIARVIGHGDEPVRDQVPFTPRAKKVLELALREALSLGHNYIGSEHVLLGLVREDAGVAARVLLDADASADAVRDRVLEQLAASSRPRPGAGSKVSWLGSPRGRRWEYRVEHDLDADGMNELGGDGWELVAAVPRGEQLQFLFKRTVRPPAPAAIPKPDPG
jgi:ATP-dependent Clp protease ATP-binding subunit ClpC